MFKLGDYVQQKGFPETAGVIVGFHKEDFSNDYPVIVKQEQKDKLIVLTISDIEEATNGNN